MELHIRKIYFVLALGFTFVSLVAALRPMLELQILHQHNRLRREYSSGRRGILVSNMRKLKWSSSLSSTADRLAKCNNVDRLKRLDKANINMAVSREANVTNMVSQWFSGINEFSPEYSACAERGVCRSFMTMMTAGNYRVGCSLSRTCWDGRDQYNILVCLYSGSDPSTYPIFKVGPPCSKCDGQMPFCEAGLCVPCAKREFCDCRKSCGKYGVGSGFLDKKSCSCKCDYGMGPNCDEECTNPEQYEDWDVCADVTSADCNDPDEEVRNLYKEFCPATCVCKKHPNVL